MYLRSGKWELRWNYCTSYFYVVWTWISQTKTQELATNSFKSQEEIEETFLRGRFLPLFLVSVQEFWITSFTWRHSLAPPPHLIDILTLSHISAYPFKTSSFSIYSNHDVRVFLRPAGAEPEVKKEWKKVSSCVTCVLHFLRKNMMYGFRGCALMYRAREYC